MRQMKVSLPGTRRSVCRLAVLSIMCQAVSLCATAQTRAQLQQNNAVGYNYQSAAYRKLFYIPEDTLSTLDSGSIAYKGGRFWLKRNPYWTDWGLRKINDTLLAGFGDTFNIKAPGSGLNFANADLTLTENRVHDFGDYGMKFGSNINFDPSVDYVGIHSDGLPGLVFGGNAENPGGFNAFRFKDAAAPTTSAGMILFYGQQQWFSSDATNGSGTIQVGPSYWALSHTKAGLQTSLTTGTIKKGITAIDNQDSTGMGYADNYKDSGLAVYGDRWIPDVGWVKTRIPDDFMYETEESDCVDTSFVNSAGVTIGHYEKKILPQYVGLRVRVSASGLQLSDDPRWGYSWYYQWIKQDGLLRIYSGGTCADEFFSQQRIIMGY